MVSTAPMPPPTSPTMSSLDKLLELTREHARTLRATQLPRERRQGNEERETSSGSHSLEDLDLFMGRLRQVKDWLAQDPHLLHLVDTHMSQHLRRIEKRQSRQNFWLAVFTTLIGALLGWLTSALASPTTLWHLLFR